MIPFRRLLSFKERSNTTKYKSRTSREASSGARHLVNLYLWRGVGRYGSGWRLSLKSVVEWIFSLLFFGIHIAEMPVTWGWVDGQNVQNMHRTYSSSSDRIRSDHTRDRQTSSLSRECLQRQRISMSSILRTAPFSWRAIRPGIEGHVRRGQTGSTSKRNCAPLSHKCSFSPPFPARATNQS